MNFFVLLKIECLSILPLRQQVLAAADSLHGVISSLQGLDNNPHWCHQSGLVAMMEHYGIIAEGKTNSISCIEFTIANDIFIL